ncbi:MAG TPA: CHAT domain-containing protein [Mycobacteriales bacterium]|nr:CHAT domain-containing protein [Mycobacteriales bacterium]
MRTGRDTALLGRARALHRRGVAATASGHPAAGADLLRRGLGLLRWPAVDAEGGPPVEPAYRPLAARLLISLAHAEAELGQPHRGLALIAAAGPLASHGDRGVLLQQHGLILLRTGRGAEALALLDASIPLLAAPEHTEVLACTLLNRAAMHLGAGRVRPARADLARCVEITRRAGLPLIAAKAAQNLAYCDLLTGDIPAALRGFEQSARGYAEHGSGFLPVLGLDRARALLAAGLGGEAGRELETALAGFRAQKLSQDRAEAELARALAALLTGDAAAARRWAGLAERRFHRRGNDAWAALAELTRLRATRVGRDVTARVAAADELAVRLAKLGLDHDAELAEWLVVRALAGAGRAAEASWRAGTLRVRPGAPLELRLVRRLARAELAQAEVGSGGAARSGGAAGGRAAAYRQLRSGLATLAEHRSRFGSLDLQAGAAALGVELATAGLEAALADGRPRLVFDWSERARAQAFRLRPVRPPADPEVAEALAELRQLRLRGREVELAGGRDPAGQRRCAELERWIRERGWQQPGTGQARTVASLGAVAGTLAEAGQTLVSFMVRRGRLVGLLVRDGGARLVELGRFAAVGEPSRRLLSDLDALAGRALPGRLAAVVRASVRGQLAMLDELLLAPLAGALGDSDLVVVPTRSLSGIPWGLLPALAGRPVTVAPSASSWLAARRAAAGTAAGPGGFPGPAVLVAGPGLTHAEAEVAELARIHPGGRTLVGAAATVPAALRALDGASIAHFATHGHHDRENVLFSRLDLVDGPLMAYDVQQLAVPPGLAILSACDVGRTVVRAGDELLGFTAALLYAGTPTVVAGVARVADEAAVRVMTAFHRELARGVRPAPALATATQAEPYVPFACFGAG